MPQCAFKNCKNNYRNSNVSDGVSYFRFPSNPFSCAEWVSIVAKERGNCFYKPAKNSIICSDHFDKLDISGNTKRRRMVKTAVPKLQIQNSTQGTELATHLKLSVSDFRVQFSENTFKQYYYPSTPDEASDEEGTLGFKVKQAIAKKRSANDIDGFFEKQKKKLKLKKKSSSVARSSSGGVSYITSNNDEGADASHLIKIEVYDMNKIKNVAPSEQWKVADVRVKYYAGFEEDKHLQSARDVIFDITKLLASKEDRSKYFIETDKGNKKYSD